MDLLSALEDVDDFGVPSPLLEEFFLRIAKAAAQLGEDGRPFIASMKRIQPNLESRCSKKAKQGDTLQKALDALKEAVKTYEDKFGEVKTG